MSAKTKDNTAEAFVESVFKFSISTFVNIGILGLSMLITGNLLTVEQGGQIDLFIGYTNTIMTLVILGLDQALIRFYYEPPKGLSSNGLFRISFYFSSLVLFVVGVFGSTVFLRPLYNLIGFEMIGYEAVPLLFLNAFFFMVARYFNVLYRMEMNVAIYTVETILMQFFYKMFYLLGAFFTNKVFAMMICSVLGLGSFALVFSFVRRKTLRPSKAEFKSGAYKTILPYGLSIAPTAVFVTLNAQIPKSFITAELGRTAQGLYSFSYMLSNVVTLIQGGFAAFWGAYMMENYRTQKARIMKMHDFINFIILSFFTFLVAAQDILFLFFRQYTGTQAQSVFPMMMLGAVFTILCETTVYGNALARRPIFDTIGIGLSLGTNILGCIILVPLLGPEYGLYGAAFSVALSNFVMFLFRTATAQRFYRTIRYPAKTAVAIGVAVAVTAAGTFFAHRFLLKLLCSAIGIGIYCLMYQSELKRTIELGLSVLSIILTTLKERLGLEKTD